MICQEDITDKLQQVKSQFEIDEIFYLATCNRVEFVLVTDQVVDAAYTERFIDALHIGVCNHYMGVFLKGASIYQDQEALNHLLRISTPIRPP